MKKILAVDGGNSKTLAVVADESGTLLGMARESGSNFQTIGRKGAGYVLNRLFDNVLTISAVISVDYGCYGIAGADEYLVSDEPGRVGALAKRLARASAERGALEFCSDPDVARVVAAVAERRDYMAEGGHRLVVSVAGGEPRAVGGLVGLYYIMNTSLLFECLDNIVMNDIRTKGEYQLTDALICMLEKGENMGAFPVEDWHDCGRPETLLETNRVLLERSGGNGNDVPGSIVIPPVSIDPSAVVERSVIGPHVSVAAGATVLDSVVRDSILNANARVEKSLLESSLIGEGAVVIGHYQRLNVGDSSVIEIGG